MQFIARSCSNGAGFFLTSGGEDDVNLSDLEHYRARAAAEERAAERAVHPAAADCHRRLAQAYAARAAQAELQAVSGPGETRAA